MISRLLLAIALATPVALTAADPIGITADTPLDLAHCVTEAVRTSKTLRQVRRQTTILDWQVQEAWAPSLPQLSASWKDTWRNNEAAADMGGQPFVTSDRNYSKGSLDATLTVMDFGRAGYYRDVVRAQRDGSAMDARRGEQAVTLATTQAFMTTLAATHFIAVAEQELHLLDRQLAVIDDLVRNGQASANDRMAVDVQRKTREQQLIRARNQQASAEAALNRLIGRPLDEHRSLTEPTEVPAWKGSRDEALRLAILYRPDLAAIRMKMKGGQAAYKSAAAALMPRVYLFGAYNGSNDNHLSNQQWWDGGIGVSFTIFDGGQTIAMAGRARDELSQVEDQVGETLDQVRLQTHQAWLALSSARERHAVAQSQVALAEDTLTRTQDRYRQGLSTSTDVLVDEDHLAQARFDFTQATYERHIAYAELVNAIGADPAKPLEAGSGSSSNAP
jgi:outer membrane protein TolC